jgi:hypothetical protein
MEKVGTMYSYLYSNYIKFLTNVSYREDLPHKSDLFTSPPENLLITCLDNRQAKYMDSN